MSTHDAFTKVVALKVLRPVSDDVREEVRRAMENEGQLGAVLQHPCIVDIYEMGEVENELYIAMEYVDGITLRQMLRNSPTGTLPVDLALEVAYHVVRGLEHAHSICDRAGNPQPVIHRDLKPTNILMARSGAVKLADFGIAHWAGNIHLSTSRALLKGTPSYASPEQAQDLRPIPPASDLFSVGTLLFEMLTGNTPYVGDNVYEVLRTIVSSFPKDQIAAVRAMSADLGDLLEKLACKDAHERFESTAELRRSLFHLKRQHPLAVELSELVGAAVVSRAAFESYWHGDTVKTEIHEP
jgi:serine/threonine-protein kinase